MPQPLWILIGTALFILVFWLRRRAARTKHLRLLRQTPLTASEREIVRKNVGLYETLPPERQHELEGLTQVFRGTKHFEGAGGLEISEEIVLTLSASACVLLLGRGQVGEPYPKLSTVLVYPTAFTGKGHRDSDSGHVVRSGESWHQGTVILSWDNALAGAVNDQDGENVILHEFAHQLDQADGHSDGTPNLGPSADRYRSWARVLGEEFLTLRSRTEAGKKTLLDSYGATNEAEFFAVATEFFFEKPERLQKNKPELYQELAEFYRQDPTHYR